MSPAPRPSRARRLAGVAAALAACMNVAAAPAPKTPAPKPPAPKTPASRPAATAAAATAFRPTPRFDLGDGLWGGARQGRIEIWTQARAGEGWLALARRATGQPSRHEALARSHAGRALREGQEIVIPREFWKPGAGAALLSRLFPKDRATAAGWRHVVTDGASLGFAESPWSLGALFAGDGKRHEQFTMDAAARGRGLRPGDVVVIPGELLLPCWRPASPGGAPESEGPRIASGERVAVTSAPPAKLPVSASPEAGAPVSIPAPRAAGASSSSVTLRGSGGLATEGAGSLEIARGAASRPDGEPPSSFDDEEAEVVTSEAAPAISAPASPEPRPREADDHDHDHDHAPGGEGNDAPVADAEPSAPAPPDDFAITPGTRSEDGSLTYALDAQGPHAIYRIQKGETLYSHVVLRFTGLLSGRDVNDAAQRFARRSRIGDVTQIRVGAAVRIPLQDLLPPFLPPGHPRRVAWQQEQAESSRLATRERRRNLDGVHVLVDVGHGGADPGAGNSRVWEDDFAYDVACRVMAVLAERTEAESHPLVNDISSGHATLSRIKRDTDEVLLTRPPYRLEKWTARSAVNLRWILANSIRRRLEGAGVPEERIVFLSFHADSLHESARGSMIYYASAQYRAARSGIPPEPGFAGLAEAVADNGFEMSRRDMLRAEGLSRALGESIVGAVARAGLPVHGFTPVRGSIVRSGTWVPAVLKFNKVQAATLVEICNLNNPDDQKNLRDPAFRQSFAEAVVDGLESYFDGKARQGSERAAR